MGPAEISKGIYLVGSADITDPKDCAVYVIDLGELIVIDTGAGTNAHQIIRNIEVAGLNPSRISTVILTHCHIDHVGGASLFRQRFGARLVMHKLDAEVVERGDERMTVAFWYNLRFAPLKIDLKIEGEEESLLFADQKVTCLHTPGHTPGSLSVYLDVHGERILFGQDIHGPFHEEFGSDLTAWSKSMQKLLALQADVLCEGHFGVFQPNDQVTAYIERYVGMYANQV